MAGNDFLGTGMQEHKIRIFTQAEMVLYILVLVAKSIAVESKNKLIFADMTGGLDSVSDLLAVLKKNWSQINEPKAVHLALT
jgi:fatty acid synthase subunit alpha